MVSDAGQGYAEAGNYGASDFFCHSAKEMCELFGTRYGDLNMFLLETSIAKMEAAIVAVVNASAIAARNAIEKATLEKSKRTNVELFDKFVDVFGKHNVSKIEEVQGRHTTWEAHDVVNLDGRTSVFEYVADHPNSISSKFMMFSDLRKNEDTDLILNAVVKDLNKISQKTQLIVDVANIVPFQASKQEFRKFVKVA